MKEERKGKERKGGEDKGGRINTYTHLRVI